MNRNVVFLLPASLFLIGATFIPQGDKPAEEVFKNIVTFKGSPAKDVLPAMKFMSASLKVKCAFCHDTKDFSADTKGEKQTARKMIQMQRDLNKQFFGGRNQVTCMSCHNGHTQPSNRPSLTGLNARHIRYTGALTAADVFKKYQDAIGSDVKSLSLTGTTKGQDGQSQPYEIIEAAPDRFLITMGQIKAGFDGTATWHSVGDHVNTLWGDNAATVQRIGRFFRGPKAFDRYDQPTIAGMDKIGDKSLIVVRGTLTADNLSEELYFEESTGLLLRVATITRTTLGLVPSFIDFSDYRSVGGVKVPFKIVSTSPEGEATEVQIDSAKPNPTVDEKVFSPPK